MQRIRSGVFRLGLILLILIPAYLFQLFAGIQSIEELVVFIKANTLLYLIGLLILKSSSIVYPPLPGVIVTLASVPVVGWEVAYGIDLLGSTIGSSIAFFLGKRYSATLMKALLGDSIVARIRKIKLKEKNQVEASIFLRFATGGLLSEGLSWGAHVIGFRYLPFIAGYVISHIISSLPIFYLLGIAVSSHSWIILLAGMILAWIIIYRFKGRYFE